MSIHKIKTDSFDTGTVNVQHTTTATVSVDGEDAAKIFWELGSEQQEMFFNYLGNLDLFVFQLQAIVDGDIINNDGRHAMQSIGEYGDSVI